MDHQSILFPEEGGQHADTGILEMNENGQIKQVKVLDGQIINGEVVYEVSNAIKENTAVLCKLDWAHRFDKMQNHSGEHILSGLIHNTFGFNNIGFHLSDDGPVTLVCDGVLTKEQVSELELETNKIIYANLPIVDTYPTKEELETISYRSKIEIDGQVRLTKVKMMSLRIFLNMI